MRWILFTNTRGQWWSGARGYSGHLTSHQSGILVGQLVGQETTWSVRGSVEVVDVAGAGGSQALLVRTEAGAVKRFLCLCSPARTAALTH